MHERRKIHLHGRWRRGRGHQGTDHHGGLRRGGHLHPPPVPPCRPETGGPLPRLHLQGRPAAGELPAPCLPRAAWWWKTTHRNSTPTGAPSSRCCLSRATISARPARKAAPANCRRWPTASGWWRRNCPISGRSARWTPRTPTFSSTATAAFSARRCVRASRTVDGKSLFGFEGRGIGMRLNIENKGRLDETTLSAADKAAHVCPVGCIVIKRTGYQMPHGSRPYRQRAHRQRHRSTPRRTRNAEPASGSARDNQHKQEI